MNYGDAIQQRLVGLAAAFKFPAVHYTSSVMGMQRCTLPERVRPATAAAWPESALFGEPPLHRRTSDRREIVGWVWRLQVQFNRDVSTEEFEASLLDHLPRIPRDPANGLDRQVDLLLEDAEYQQPVMQQPSQGLRVTYRFTAQLTPS